MEQSASWDSNRSSASQEIPRVLYNQNTYWKPTENWTHVYMNLFTRNSPYYHLFKLFTIPPETPCIRKRRKLVWLSLLSKDDVMNSYGIISL